MNDNVIADGKYVEVTYKVIDQISGGVLTQVEFPLGYVHGTNEILAPPVMAELEGKEAGEVIEVPIDCKQDLWTARRVTGDYRSHSKRA